MDQIWSCELEALRVYCEKVLKATDEAEKEAFLFFADDSEPPKILSVDGETATIKIEGVLRNTPSIMSRFFGLGSTTYGAIRDALAEVAANEAIKTVRLAIDSPGGGVTGVDETWIALRDLGRNKRIVAENRGLMASAAYWLASAAREIVATSPAAETGSIGVYALITDYSEADKARGIRDIRIVSKNAPNKNPDVATKSGLAAYQARIDAIERVFIDRVAEGRGIDRETVESDFGRGGVLIARDPDETKPSALSVGMIDAVADAGEAIQETGEITAGANSRIDNKGEKIEKQDHRTKTADAVTTNEGENMNLAELKAQHPELWAEIETLIAEAREAAEKAARAEVEARNKETAPILAGDYPEKVKEIARSVLAGESTIAELRAAASVVDSMREATNTESAEAETTATGETPPAAVTSSDGTGEIRTEEDYQAEVARTREAHGLEAK